MPIPPYIKEPGVPLAAKPNPWQAYQQALATYQGAPANQLPAQPSYEAYGQPQAAGAEDPVANAAKIAAAIAVKKAILGGAAQTAAGTAGSAAGTAAGTMAQGTLGIGLKGGAGAVGATQGATTAAAPTMLGNAAGMGALPIAGILAGTYLGGKSAYDMIKGRNDNSIAGKIGRGTLGIATGGLSEIARASGLFGHKSTKDRQQERWQGLLEAGNAPEWAFANGVNQDMGVDDNKLAAGTLGGRDVWATSGMFDTFGGNWANTGNELQRETIAKQMLDNKLFDTKKGVTYVTDKNKAMDIYNKVLADTSLTKLLQAPARSSTSSPGIGKDGKRINYGAKK